MTNPAVFLEEQAKPIAREVIEKTIETEEYSHSKVGDWSAAIAKATVDKLVALKTSHKFIVDCVVLQKSTAGFHAKSACHWNDSKDGHCTVQWENKSLVCWVNIFAISLS